eukprot:TRINITY_DN6592_c0_g2_i1.p1 TRINITY_DN6592_c0_g2~~TRINITY_DN6592_c0_g2_i1.p1  ORF type:complete len:310 (+),score=32.95 TRINITY_DN6592_c0_g2_i1:49-978(+)
MTTKAAVYSALAPVYEWQEDPLREHSFSPTEAVSSPSIHSYGTGGNKNVDIVLLSVDESEDVVPQHFQKHVRFSDDTASTVPMSTASSVVDADAEAIYQTVLPLIKGTMAMSGLQLNSNIRDRIGIEALSAMAILQKGIFLTKFDRNDGVAECSFYIVSDHFHQQLSFHQLSTAVIPYYLRVEVGEMVQQYPLNALYGVQQGVQTSGFKYFVTPNGYAKGVKSKGKRALIPARFCFTLWIKNPDGSFSPLSLAAVNEKLFNICIAGYSAIRGLNTTHNYTLKENIHQNIGSPHDITKWVAHSGGNCAIL